MLSQLDSDVKSLNSDLEKMFDKWQEKKPKDKAQMTIEEALEMQETMKEQLTAWADAQKRVERVTNTCSNFNKPKP